MSDEVQQYMPGEVIRNRNRLWRVDDVSHNNKLIRATSLDGNTSTHQFYAPVEHIEPGDMAPPDTDRLGNPQFQDLLIQSHRLSMLHGTAPLMSLQRSRVIPTEYQLTPVVMALNMPRVRMLLADDVGLGKTIEAGLITSELLARNRAERILIITPANLREQWREAFSHFFHINPEITSRRRRKAMEKEIPPGTSPWDYYSKHIVSIDYAKQPHVRHEILEQDWDLVIIDEAHQAAKPHTQSANQSVNKQRWEFADKITQQAKHALLLTATPHNGYKDSYASLLKMVRPELVTGPGHNPSINRELAKKHVVQRRREDVEEWFGKNGETNPFPKRDQKVVNVKPTSYDTRMYDAIRDYGDALFEAAEESDNRTLAQWTMVHFLKRALSSPEALRRSLKNRKGKLEERLETLEVDAATPEENAGVSESMARANALDNDPGEDYSEEELGKRVERVVSGDEAAIRIELKALEDALEAAGKVTKTRDGKLKKLLNKTLPGRFGYKRTIIFTKYRDTLEYLEQQISDEFDDLDVITLFGDLTDQQRAERFEKFSRSNRAVLIATDVISEGMNLQHASNQVIHYELPWNPNRLEQRNGRVDRYGQPKHEVVIRTMVVDDPMDRAVLETLIKKAQEIRAEYGFSPPYLDDDEGVLKLIRQKGLDIGVPQLTLGDFQGGDDPNDDQTAFDEDILNEIKDQSFYGHSEVDLSEVQARQKKAQEMLGGPDAVETFVRSGLNLFDCKLKANVDGTLELRVSNDELHGPDIQTEYEKVTFDPERSTQDNDIEMLDIAHPLVQRLIEAVKEVALNSEDRYGRTALRGVDVIDERMAVYTGIARYFVHTSEDPMVMEELIQVGLPLYGDEPLSPEVVQKVLGAEPKAAGLLEQEAKYDLKKAINHDAREHAFETRASSRLAEIRDERKAMQRRLEDAGYGESVKDIDRISLASTDLLTVGLYTPV